ncbi:hypothetical protein BKA70DRAFT_1403139 [Coprinopsis sp. MPI-PUGE-AT-0042]|nr:hypothetical protein BKA70DRAFT_1403139 [Coprinopsis sp. MPI-PUGE-AT-0042]
MSAIKSVITLPLSVLLAALPYLAATNAQSDAPPSSLPSDQPLQPSTPGPGATNTPSIGGGTGGNAFQLQDYLTFLNASGYTALSNALGQANGTSDGRQWISQLTDGNWTVFAPTNDAFAAVPQELSSNTTALADYLSYHFVHGDLSGPPISPVTPAGPLPAPSVGPDRMSRRRLFSRQDQGLPAPESPESPQGQPGQGDPQGQLDDQLLSTTFPNTTIARTALNASDFVQLEGGKAQVLAWTRFESQPNVTILNQLTSDNQNVTVGNATHWRNLSSPRSTVSWYPLGPSLRLWRLSPSSDFVNFVGQVQLPDSNGTNVSAIEAFQSLQGFTLFAPSSSVAGLMETLQGINQANVPAILMNHIADNSTSDGSDDSMDITSAGGQSFSFTSNSTGLFVSVGNDTIAQVVQPDILVENGVIHLIDRLLFQSDSDSSEASAAVSSYSSAAAADTSTDTQAIIYPFPTPSTDISSDQPTATVGTSIEVSATPDVSVVPPSMPSSFRIRRGLL